MCKTNILLWKRRSSLARSRLQYCSRIRSILCSVHLLPGTNIIKGAILYMAFRVPDIVFRYFVKRFGWKLGMLVPNTTLNGLIRPEETLRRVLLQVSLFHRYQCLNPNVYIAYIIRYIEYLFQVNWKKRSNRGYRAPFFNHLKKI